MGDPKRQRRKFDTPRFPWRKDILQEELKLLGTYGLRNKHELWRHETMLSKFRGIARSLMGQTPDERVKMENELLTRLKKIGVLQETAVLDDVLDLSIEDILERRLQTIIFRKSLSKTPYQARQLITHGHVVIGNRRVTVPGYIVSREDEKVIDYSPDSQFVNAAHPTRVAMTIVTKQPEIRQPNDRRRRRGGRF
ncbi:MAG: 30S ribosomal protein S4 [Candidatus Bathyarchaeota archaeon]|nr:30S ribosomal protein S4 [Candidatus Bathyarchaeota archaeon]